MKRSGLRAVSPKRAKLNRQRMKVVNHIRSVQDWCSMCGQTGLELHGHELRGRGVGGSIVDLENIILLCNPCNTWCEDNPREAAEQGFKISKKWERL